MPGDSGVRERADSEWQFQETGSSFVSTGVRTGTEPVARPMNRFGPIEEARWVLEGPGPAHPALRPGRPPAATTTTRSTTGAAQEETPEYLPTSKAESWAAWYDRGPDTGYVRVIQPRAPIG